MEHRHRHQAYSQQPQWMSGMKCPNCDGFIPISMYQILAGSSVFCPRCGLRLDINTKDSARAIEALRKVEKAQRRVEETSHFDGSKR